MPNLAEKLRFCETYIRTKSGEPFSIKGREWVRDELFLPADGFKLWKIEDSEPCAECLEHVTRIIEHPADNPTKDCKCGGLSAEPIIITALNLARQEGKTFNSAAYTLATMFLNKNKYFAGLWASEAQGTQIFEENHKSMIDDEPRLRARCSIAGRPPILRTNSKSKFETLATNFKTATGRGRTHIVVDEARDIPSRIAMALMPSVFAQGGVECPSGHVQLSLAEGETAPSKCTACGQRLVPWYPRIIVTSSSGVIDDNPERMWFMEFIETFLKNPHKNVHIFRQDEPQNPAKSKVVIDTFEEVFGQLESTAQYVSVEAGNKWTRQGEEVVSAAHLKRVMDKTQLNQDSFAGPCVGFLDTSITVDKTSLVILAEDPASDHPWQRLTMPRLDYWIPEAMPSGVMDDKQVIRLLETLVPLYPGLRTLRVDVRGMPWALDMVKAFGKRGGIYSKISGWNLNRDEGDMGWAIFEQRIREQTITLQHSKYIIKEFTGLTRKPDRMGRLKIVDKNRNKSHKDITESIAICCYLAQLQQMRGDGASMNAIKQSEDRIKTMRKKIEKNKRKFTNYI